MKANYNDNKIKNDCKNLFNFICKSQILLTKKFKIIKEENSTKQFVYNIVKKINNRINNILKNLSEYKIFLYLLIIINSIIFVSNSSLNKSRKLIFSYEITIIIQGKGTQNILCSDNVNGYYFADIPDEIFVNGNLQSDLGYVAKDLLEEKNTVRMIWYSSLSNLNVMFYGLTNLLEVDLSKFESSSVTSILKMFQKCTSLTSINFNNFITPNIKEMRDAFAECTSLISLDLSSFDTSSVNKMDSLFYTCSSLISLNLKNFVTNKVTSMKQMFCDCKNLINLDVSSFSTSLVTNMYGMFKGCKSLLSLNLKNFNTNKVTNMNRLFSGCNKLTSLDISNFDTSSVTDMEQMFYNCKKLTSLNLSNFDTSSVKVMNSMFNECNSLTSLNLNNFKTSSVTTMILLFNNCKNLVSLNIDNFETSKVTNMYSMFSNCGSLISLNLNSFSISKANNFSYMFTNSNHDIIYCFNETKLSKISERLIIDNPNYKNNCSDICFSDKIIKIVDNKKCVYDCINNEQNVYEDNYLCYDKDNFCNPLDFFKDICRISTDQKEEEKMINQIRKEILENSFSTLIYNILNEDKIDYSVLEDNIIYQLTSTYNQYNYNYNNISTIKLGDCETKLKDYYNISDNESLLMFKVDYLDKFFLHSSVEYEVYDYKERKQLNLSICENISIEIDFPLSSSINENELFRYNLSSDYYYDRCFPYTTDNGTDIILNDRKNEYYNNNMSLCEENCEFYGYDNENNKALCKCKVKTKLFNKSKPNFDKEIFVKLLNIKNTINIYVLKCFKLFFSKNGLIRNIGSYILLLIIASNIGLLIYFLVKEYNYLYLKIDELIISNKNEVKLNRAYTKTKKKHKAKGINIKKKNTFRASKNQIVTNKNKKLNSKSNPSKNKYKKRDIINESKGNEFSSAKSQQFLKIKDDNNIKIFEINQTNKIVIDIAKYNDYEINTLSYSNALKLDKRTFSDYYISLLKRKQILIFTFYTNDDYNLKTIKLSLLLFSFALYFTINTLFFSDSTMHKIYVEKGTFNIIYQLPQILYSAIISAVFFSIINYLSLSEKNVLKIKNAKENNDKNLIQIVYKVKKCLKIKFLLYFLLQFLFLIFFWYYLGCFCAVYINTQIQLIKDTALSYLLSLIYPFGFSLLPGIFRISALNTHKGDKECIYNLSRIFQLI